VLGFIDTYMNTPVHLLVSHIAFKLEEELQGSVGALNSSSIPEYMVEVATPHVK